VRCTEREARARPHREKDHRDDHRGASPWAEIGADDPKAAICSRGAEYAVTGGLRQDLERGFLRYDSRTGAVTVNL